MSSSIVPMVMRDFFLDDPFFQSTWEDFDKVRDRMIEKSRKFWNDSSFQSSLDSNENSRISKSAEFSSSSSSSSHRNESSIKSDVSNSNTASKDLISNNFFNRAQDRASGSSWMFPRGWLIPELRSEFKDINLFKENNTEVIRVINDEKKLEICLDTSQYKPSELKVLVKNGTISIEGKHEEKAEDGSKMVSRQFIRRYTLPEGSKAEDVVSNLSSDGVLVITANKSSTKDRFVEIKNDDNKSSQISNEGYSKKTSDLKTSEEKIKVEDKKSSAKEFLSQTISSAIKEKSEEKHTKNETVQKVEVDRNASNRKLNVPIKMDADQADAHVKHSTNLISASNRTSQDSSRIKVDIKQQERANFENEIQNKPLKVNIMQDAKSARKNSIKDENFHNSITSHNASKFSEQKISSNEKSEISSASRHQRSSSEEKKVSFNTSQEESKLSTAKNHSEGSTSMAQGNDYDRDIIDFNDRTGWHSLKSWFFPKFMEEKHSDIIKYEENDDKLELKLDASKYKPEELRVSVDHGMILVEGKHEEKAEDGHIMVSRQFSRKYSLPAGSRAEDVVSNLSDDGILVITANKSKLFKEKIDVEIKKR